MSSDEDEGPAGLAAELERYDRKAERREAMMIGVQAAIVVMAVSSLILWALGGSLIGALLLLVIAAQATGGIYGQRTIRLLRRHGRDLQQHLDKAYDLVDLLRR